MGWYMISVGVIVPSEMCIVLTISWLVLNTDTNLKENVTTLVVQV